MRGGLVRICTRLRCRGGRRVSVFFCFFWGGGANGFVVARDGMVGTGTGTGTGGSPGSDGGSYLTAREASQSPLGVGGSVVSRREDTVATSRVHMPEAVLFTPSVSNSRASSLFASTPSTRSEENVGVVDWEGYDSPPPADERIAEVRNERRYRLLLVHEFHPSRACFCLFGWVGADGLVGCSDAAAVDSVCDFAGCCWVFVEAEWGVCDAV